MDFLAGMVYQGSQKILQVIFLVLTIFLLYNEFRLYFLHETNTSVSKTKIGPKNFPQIIMCPVPSFDQEFISKYGYKNSYKYSQGQVIGKETIVDWTGNSSFGVEIVESNVSILRNDSNCPKETYISFEVDGLPVYEKVSYKVTKPLHPYGQCCKVIKPMKAEKELIDTFEKNSV